MERKVDMLQARMDAYVDKICDPKTSPQARDFLKSQLRDDYYELRDLIPRFHAVGEGWRQSTTHEVRDKKTPVNPKGGFRTCDKCGKSFSRLGIARHNCVPAKESISEAVNRVPLTVDDFEMVKLLLNKPIPATIAPIYIEGLINDDELTDQFKSVEESEPSRDVRPLIVEWFRRVMPDQLYRFTGDLRDATQEKGILSPIHGYDPKMYKGTNDPITGDAFGRV